jgi:hypothetical protein
MTSAASSMIAAKRVAFTALALVSIVALPSVARADGTSADALFREGRTLLDAKKYDEACPKLAESQKADPGAGTLLALALCHEGQGKTATEGKELNEAAALGKSVGRNDLAGAAQKRASAMEPLLSKIVVHVPKVEDAEYQVKCDGELLDSKQWDTPIPVDPGEHHVDVSAKGKRSRSYAVRLTGAGVVEILIDKLDDSARAPVAVTKPASTPVRLDTTEPPALEPNRGGTQRTLGLAVVGLGVVGLGVGAYFGGKGLSESAEGRRACAQTPCSAQEKQDSTDANDRAKSSMLASIVTIGAGTGAIALGTIVYLMAPSSPTRGAAPSTRMTARFAPSVTPTQATVGMTGSF